jgi:hypothetical protein
MLAAKWLPVYPRKDGPETRNIEEGTLECWTLSHGLFSTGRTSAC